MKNKIYKCCICHQEIKNTNTIRLAKQLYGINRYGGHYTIEFYDFCERCYKVFNGWINKHKEEI